MVEAVVEAAVEVEVEAAVEVIIMKMSNQKTNPKDLLKVKIWKLSTSPKCLDLRVSDDKRSRPVLEYCVLDEGLSFNRVMRRVVQQVAPRRRRMRVLVLAREKEVLQKEVKVAVVDAVAEPEVREAHHLVQGSAEAKEVAEVAEVVVVDRHPAQYPPQCNICYQVMQ